MLKLIVHIQCEDCGVQFPYARTSAYTSDAVSFNVNALSALLPNYKWKVSRTGKKIFHYCPSCDAEYNLQRETLAF